MFFWNNYRVPFGARMNIQKSQHMIIFINRVIWYFLIDDFTKETIHMFFKLIIFNKYVILSVSEGSLLDRDSSPPRRVRMTGRIIFDILKLKLLRILYPLPRSFYPPLTNNVPLRSNLKLASKPPDQFSGVIHYIFPPIPAGRNIHCRGIRRQQF